jgi:carboxypeptidase Q
MRQTTALLSFCFVLVAGQVSAQEKVDAAMMEKIREEGLKRSQVAFIAHQLTDVAGSRLTNSPGYKRAANWIVATTKQWGLQHAQAEPWGEFGKGWELEKSYAALKAPYYQPVIAYPFAWSAGTKGLVTAPVTFLYSLDSATIKKQAADLKGKIVFQGDSSSRLRSAFTAYASRYTDSQLVNMKDMFWFTRAMLEFYLPMMVKEKNTKEFLFKQGIVALVTKNSTGRDGTIFVDGTEAFKKGVEATVPEVALSTEDFQKIQRLVAGGTPVKMELEVKSKFYTDDLKGRNVIAEIPGTDPTLKSEVVMLGGHLDSWHSGTGATDNAAGCIVALEAVRILKTLGVQPKRTIRVALWDGEEQGLYGSYHYVLNHFGDPGTMQLKPEQEKVSAYYNLDNGSGKIRGIFAQENDAVVPIFQAWLEPFKDLGAATVTKRNTGSTDHQALDAVGIPSFQFIQDPLEYETRTHHSNMDTYDHLQIEDLKQAAIIMAAFVYNTAMRAEKLPRKPLPKAGTWIFEGF